MSTQHSAVDSDALLTAVGLAWGWLEQGSPAHALTLVRACLMCWPDEPVLHLLQRQCLVELNQPWPQNLAASSRPIPAAWRPLAKKLENRHRMVLAAHAAGIAC
jgi:hypothetical protein